MPRAFIWHWGQLICRNCWLCLTICCNVLLLEKKDDIVMTVILLTFWTDLYSHLKKIVFRAVFAAALWKAKYTQSTFKSNNIFFHKFFFFWTWSVFFKYWLHQPLRPLWNFVPLFFTTLLRLIEVCGDCIVHSSLKILPQHFNLFKPGLWLGHCNNTILFFFIDLLLCLGYDLILASHLLLDRWPDIWLLNPLTSSTKRLQGVWLFPNVVLWIIGEHF